MTTDDSDKRHPITPPKGDKLRAIGRAAVEGLVDIVPGGAVVTGIAREALPPQSEKDRDQWEKDVSERSNEQDARLDRHDAFLAPTETITGLPARMLVRLVQECPDGMAAKNYDLDQLCAMFPEEEKQAVSDAAHDLEAVGMVAFRSYIGGWWAMLADEAYEQVDHQVMGWSTASDALTLAKMMLEGNTGHAPELHNKTGWSNRRFNPAFRKLLPLFPEGRIRRVIQPDYPSLGVLLIDEDRAILRRYIARGVAS